MSQLKEEFSPLARFSNRVEDYVKYRPSYPQALVDFLTANTKLGPESVVADVGSGTGIFTRLLLATGTRVLAIEPNAAMRAAAEFDLRENPRFTSIDASAEATTLPDESVSLITAAQAFHWFDLERARREFARILKPKGKVALIWNAPKIDSDFAREYETIKENFGTDFRKLRDSVMEDEKNLQDFFRGGFTEHTFPNHQDLDETGLVGRFFSSSYAPKRGTSEQTAAERELNALFLRSQQGGRVRMNYATKLMLGAVAN